MKLEGKCTSSGIIQMGDVSSFVVLAQETKILYFIQPFDLFVKMSGPSNDIVDTFAFSLFIA